MVISKSKSTVAISAIMMITILISNSNISDAFSSQRIHHARFGIQQKPSTIRRNAAAAMPDPDWEGSSSSSKASSSSSSSSSDEVPRKDPASSFGPRHHPINPPSSVSASAASTSGNTENKKEDSELPLPPQVISTQRKNRMNREKELESKFLHGDDLIELRNYMNNLEADLETVTEQEINPQNAMKRMRDVKKKLNEAKSMDAEHVYKMLLENVEIAEKNGDDDLARECYEEAMETRSCLSQYNLEGLWVGKYGEHGYEMINVTYVGDTLIATKVTGDKNVPKGEITFKANLHPSAPGRSDLEPIELSEVAARQWGHKHLPRFPGEGQVAAEGFVNNQYMEGQLILVGDYFSFAWIPIGHQIFFGRPSAELTMKMLKQSQMSDFGAMDKDSTVGEGDVNFNEINDLAEMRAVAQRCLEETDLLIYDEEGVEGELCFLSDDEYYFSQEGCFE